METLEEKFYEIAVGEVARGHFVSGLMAKAYSEANGDKDRTIAGYIRLRAQELIEDHDAEIEEQAVNQMVERTQKREETEVSKPETAVASPVRTPLCETCRYYTEAGFIELCNGHCTKHNRTTGAADSGRKCRDREAKK